MVDKDTMWHEIDEQLFSGENALDISLYPPTHPAIMRLVDIMQYYQKKAYAAGYTDAVLRIGNHVRDNINEMILDEPKRNI